MNFEKLKEVVTEEAKEEKDRLLNEVSKEVNDFLDSEKRKLDNYYNEKRQKIEQEYSSRATYINFLLESEFRKKLLRFKHSLLEEAKQFLTDTLVDEIKNNPEKFVKLSLKELRLREGKFLVSKELSEIITEKIFYKSAKDLPLEYGGIDFDIETGVAIELANKKYIFFLREIVEKFLLNNFLVNGLFDR